MVARTKAKSQSALDLETLSSEWDSDPDIRERLRDGGSFLHPKSSSGEDIPTCVLNKELLTPLLVRMSMTEKKQLPCIHDLHASVESLLTLHKRPPKPEDFDDNMALTWRVRFMLGFVKMKARRQEVSKVARLFCLETW